MTKEQLAAMKKVPSCVELDQLDGTWEHVVFRVEHPVCIRSEGEDFYTLREARSCQRWLKKHAPQSEYANIQLPDSRNSRSQLRPVRHITVKRRA